MTRKTKSAFSLIEVVIVMLILGITATLTIPMIRDSNRGYRAELSAQKLAADLQLASTFARAQSLSVSVEFIVKNDTTNGSYTIDDVNVPITGGKVEYDFGTGSYAAVLDQAPDKIVFDSHGYPDRDTTIVINDSFPSRKEVVVTQTAGRIVVQ